MMLGGGCGHELANWIVHGRPEKDMYSYDIRQVWWPEPESRAWGGTAGQRDEGCFMKKPTLKSRRSLGSGAARVGREKAVVGGSPVESRISWRRSCLTHINRIPLFYCTDGETEAREKDPAGTIVRTKSWAPCPVAQHESDSTLGRLCAMMQDSQHGQAGVGTESDLGL